ncbi:MAG: response regulator transcription factor [Gaiellaceae bacterium]
MGRTRGAGLMHDQSNDQISLPVRVVTVDDQAVFRRVAREVVDATSGFEALGEASSGEEALQLADRVSPDLVLVDVRMPGLDGLETTRRLIAAHPESVVVLITTEDAAAIPSAARSCGAAALIRKEEFAPATLRRLWSAHGPAGARRASSV